MNISPAYVAGIIDGEGCIVVRFTNTRISNSMICAVEITNSHRPMLEAIHAEYGGKFYGHKGQPSRSKLQTWRLRWTGDALDRLIREVAPFSIVKREQFEVLAFARSLLKDRGKRHRALTGDEIALRRQVIDDLACARKAGTTPW